jgi:hypothetical protein
MVSEFFGKFLFEVVGRGLLIGTIYVIETQIIKRRNLLVRYGRKCQKALRLPKRMCIFAETDPGILQTDIRMGILCLGSAWGFVGAGALVATATGTIWNPLVLGLGVVAPGFFVGILWLVLAASRRRLEMPLSESEILRIDRRGGDMRELIWVLADMWTILYY